MTTARKPIPLLAIRAMNTGAADSRQAVVGHHDVGLCPEHPLQSLFAAAGDLGQVAVDLQDLGDVFRESTLSSTIKTLRGPFPPFPFAPSRVLRSGRAP